MPLSSHLHLLADIDNGEVLAAFMEYACSNLAREVNRLTGWEGPVFAGRYHAIIVSPEERAQVAESFDRYRYATPETVHLSPLPCWQHLAAPIRRDLPGACC